MVRILIQKIYEHGQELWSTVAGFCLCEAGLLGISLRNVPEWADKALSATISGFFAYAGTKLAVWCFKRWRKNG